MGDVAAIGSRRLLHRHPRLQRAGGEIGEDGAGEQPRARDPGRAFRLLRGLRPQRDRPWGDQRRTGGPQQLPPVHPAHRFWPIPNWSPVRTTLLPSNTTSTTFSLCTMRPCSSVSLAMIFFVFASTISPVDGHACRPSIRNVIQPG